MSEELKPCPWCGGKVELGFFAMTPNIHCEKCEYERDFPGKKAHEAEEIWNTRAQLSQARNAALEEAAKVCDASNSKRLEQRVGADNDYIQGERFRVGALQSRLLAEDIRALKSPEQEK